MRGESRPKLGPEAQRRIYGFGAIGFTALSICSYLFGFQSNVAYVSKLSEVALVGACLACYQAVRGEVKQDIIIDAVPGAEHPE
jgi:hypothetical protein